MSDGFHRRLPPTDGCEDGSRRSYRMGPQGLLCSSRFCRVSLYCRRNDESILRLVSVIRTARKLQESSLVRNIPRPHLPHLYDFSKPEGILHLLQLLLVSRLGSHPPVPSFADC